MSHPSPEACAACPAHHLGNWKQTIESTAHRDAGADIAIPLTGALDSLAEIPVYRGSFKVEPTKTVDMILAHEVQAVVPEAVLGEHDGETMQAWDASKMVPRIIAALKEVKGRLEAGGL